MILDQYAKPITSRNQAKHELRQMRRHITQLKAKYDASRNTDYNTKYWENADIKSPDAANSPDVLRKLRARSRYEVVESNPYLQGAALTLCNDFVGTGPTLKITDRRLTAKEREVISTDWTEWFQQTKIRQKLWNLRMNRLVGGEGSGLYVTDETLEHPVKLYPRLFECDHIGSPFKPTGSEIDYDGIRVNPDTDKPTEYHIYHTHPGSSMFFNALPSDGTWVPAKNVIHWLKKQRLWHRGIPELTASLPLCALLRRYTLATVIAAETASCISAIIESQQLPSTSLQPPWAGGDSVTGEVDEEALDIFPIEYGMLMKVPDGTKVTQLDPKQPIAMYDKFVDALLREIFRPILVPFNVGSGYSGGFNMASGSLDIQLYRTGVETDRRHCDEDIMTPMFSLYWEEARLVSIPPRIVTKLENKPPKHSWGWDSVRDEHTDPLKVANAISTKLAAGIISDTDVQQTLYNRTVEEHYENLKKQQEARTELGLPIGKSAVSPGSSPENDDDDIENDTEDTEDTENDNPDDDQE